MSLNNAGASISHEMKGRSAEIAEWLTSIMWLVRVVIWLFETPLFAAAIGQVVNIHHWLLLALGAGTAAIYQWFILTCSFETFVSLGNERVGSAERSLIFSAIFATIDVFVIFKSCGGFNSAFYIIAGAAIVAIAAELRAYLLHTAKN